MTHQKASLQCSLRLLPPEVELAWTWHLELARHNIIMTLDVIRINMSRDEEVRQPV
jgi:hypothetical protein